MKENFLSLSGNVHAVVKANAYGHGALPVAKTLSAVGCKSFCVADFSEAVELRKEIDESRSVIVLGFVPPPLAKNCSLLKITPTVFSFAHALALSDNLSISESLSVFVALDTGMNRKGVKCVGDYSAARDELKEILRLPKIKVDGVYTHFHAADGSMKGERTTERQRKAFYASINGIIPAMTDISLSTHKPDAIDGFKPGSVRAGLSLYGYPDKTPVMKLVSTIVDLKFVKKGEFVGYGFSKVCADTKIAVVPIGYADGVLPAYSDSFVSVYHGNNRYLCRIFGRVCMDFTFVDVRNLPVVPGDKVVFFGETPSQLLTVAKNKLPVHSLLTAVSSRVKRVYKQ